MAAVSLSVSETRSDTSSVEVSKLTTGLVEIGAHDAVDELAGGFLLELEALADAVAGVDENAQPQGQVGLRCEVRDGCRRLPSMTQNRP